MYIYIYIWSQPPPGPTFCSNKNIIYQIISIFHPNFIHFVTVFILIFLGHICWRGDETISAEAWDTNDSTHNAVN